MHWGISGKTNDNMSMVEYVADVDEDDQQPYGERDKATNTGSKVAEWILISCKRLTKPVTSRLYMGAMQVMV